MLYEYKTYKIMLYKTVAVSIWWKRKSQSSLRIIWIYIPIEFSLVFDDRPKVQTLFEYI